LAAHACIPADETLLRVTRAAGDRLRDKSAMVRKAAGALLRALCLPLVFPRSVSSSCPGFAVFANCSWNYAANCDDRCARCCVVRIVFMRVAPQWFIALAARRAGCGRSVPPCRVPVLSCAHSGWSRLLLTFFAHFAKLELMPRIQTDDSVVFSLNSVGSS